VLLLAIRIHVRAGLAIGRCFLMAVLKRYLQGYEVAGACIRGILDLHIEARRESTTGSGGEM